MAKELTKEQEMRDLKVLIEVKTHAIREHEESVKKAREEIASLGMKIATTKEVITVTLQARAALQRALSLYMNDNAKAGK